MNKAGHVKKCKSTYGDNNVILDLKVSSEYTYSAVLWREKMIVSGTLLFL